jgi:peptidoglycan/xylan/chitin deacetylase (PgdA/CDA1 family)
MARQLHLILTSTILGLIFGPQIQAKNIALTIDDLPCVSCADFNAVRMINERIVRILKEHGLPAVGFVNEAKLYTEGRPDIQKIAILRLWLDNGFELGNHTFSHISIQQASVSDYEQDLLRGELITRPLMKDYGKTLQYFRHPQLRTGPTADYKAALEAVLARRGYIVAPVTMDSDEYLYASCYRQALEHNHPEEGRRIGADYLEYMSRIIKHYEDLSRDFLGYDLNQILLLHVSQLNADYLDGLIKILQARNYSFATLEDALRDPAYRLPEAISPKGISWIERWRLARGLTMRPQPEVSQWILRLLANGLERHDTGAGPDVNRVVFRGYDEPRSAH